MSGPHLLETALALGFVRRGRNRLLLCPTQLLVLLVLVTNLAVVTKLAGAAAGGR
jgi:hypothetical protein